MKPLYVAFIWHQHQPYYKNPQTNEYLLPWVRMHSTKDYYDMAAILDNFPKIKQTFNITPSLMEQIIDYSNGATDKFLVISQKPAKELTKEDKIFILKNFFMVNSDTMIDPYPRYQELFRRRGWFITDEYLARIEPLFNAADIRDMIVWFNLAWIDPYFRNKNEKIKTIFLKGKYFSEEDKNMLLEEMLGIIPMVLPKHRELQDRGQIEVITSPFYHPILPLLIDTNIAKIGMPFVNLPKTRFQQPEDAEWHVKNGIEMYERIFGRKPKGMWPSEGSVSPDVVPLVAKYGIKWIATDEEILFKSLPKDSGIVSNLLYMPHRVKINGSSVNMLFRDHTLSDLIGFVYYKMNPEAAADDFIGRLKKIQESFNGNGAEEHIVTIILDGENCWEYYKNDGWDFLSALYRKLSNEPALITTTVSGFLENFPPKNTLPALFPGSWINGNFGIWIGHSEDNQAWDYLNQARKFLIGKSADNGDQAEAVKKAWREIYIAEGSDWNWWYGGDHSSANDMEFDMLFRSHLINVYKLLGEKIPNELYVSIKKKGARSDIVMPVDFIKPVLDGKVTSYFEWHNAGYYDISKAGGAMHQTDTYMKSIYWGFDLEKLYIRLDYNYMQPSKDMQLKIVFIKPQGKVIAIDTDKKIVLNNDSGGIEYAVGKKGIIEISIDFEFLGTKTGEQIEFVIITDQNNTEFERWPYRSSIALTQPDNNYLDKVWKL